MQVEFYKIVSQIIPIFFLGLTLQSIFISRSERYTANESFKKTIHVMAFVSSILILIMGEYSALRSVYLNTNNAKDLSVVILSMIFGSIWISSEYILALIGKYKKIYYIGLMLISLIFNVVVFINLT